MSPISLDRIMCFECAEVAQPLRLDGVDHVHCSVCDQVETLDKAMDDCFVYMVASAASPLVASTMHRSYRFMPMDSHREAALRSRAFMIRSGRARKAAA